MKIVKIYSKNVHITPTEKKFKRAKVFAEDVSGEIGLPKEMPLERNVYLQTAADRFEQIKNKIQLAVEHLISGK